MCELGGDNLIVGNRRGKQADVLGETVHVGNSFFSNDWIVIRQVTPDQFGNELRFGWRKPLLAYFRGPAHILFESFMSFHDRSDCGASALGLPRDATLRSHERGESIMPRLGRP